MNKKPLTLIILSILMLKIALAVSTIPFWIEHNETGQPLQNGYIWTKLNLTANQSKTIYVYYNGSNDDTNLTNGLIAYYKLNGTAKDYSGNNNDGVVYGPVGTTDRFGRENEAMYFDGVDDYIDIDNSNLHNILDFTSSNSEIFTVSVWINSNELLDSSNSREARIITDLYGGGGGWDIKQYNGYLRMYYWNNGWYYIGFPNIFKNNKWYNVIIVEENGIIKFYINGILKYTSSQITISTYDNAVIHIGGLGDSNSWHGIIDEVRIYNRSLSDEEIKKLYQETAIKFADGEQVFEFFDDFDGSELGSGWQIGESGYNIQDSKIIAENSPNNEDIYRTDLNIPHPFKIVGYIKSNLHQSINIGEEVPFNVSSARNYQKGYGIEFYPQSSPDAWYVQKSDESHTITTIGNISEDGFTGIWFKYGMIVDTNIIKVLRNEQEIFSVNENTYNGTYTTLDLYSNSESSCDTEYDYIYITKYSSTEPTITYGQEETGNFIINNITFNKRKAITITSPITLMDYQVPINYSQIGNERILITAEGYKVYMNVSDFYVGTNATMNCWHNETTGSLNLSILYDGSVLASSYYENVAAEDVKSLSYLIPQSLAHQDLTFRCNYDNKETKTETKQVLNSAPELQSINTNWWSPSVVYVNTTVSFSACGNWTDKDRDSIIQWQRIEFNGQNISWINSTYTIPVDFAHSSNNKIYCKVVDSYGAESNILSTSFSNVSNSYTYWVNLTGSNEIALTDPTTFTYALYDLDNDSHFTIYAYINNTLIDTAQVSSREGSFNISVPYPFYGDRQIIFKVNDGYDTSPNTTTHNILVYSYNITFSYYDESGNPIDLSGVSAFSCTDVYPVSSTSSSQHYKIICPATWYEFRVSNTTVNRHYVLTSYGTQSKNIYIFQPTLEYLIKPIQIADSTGKNIYILRDGKEIHSERQDSLGKIYPYLVYGRRYSIATKEGDNYKIIGDFIPIDNSLLILYMNSISISLSQDSFWNKVHIERGFLNHSIYVNYSDTTNQTNSVQVDIYYLKNNSYYLAFHQTVNNQNNIFFIHPFTSEEEALRNETMWKVDIQIDHNQYGDKRLTYYLKQTDRLFFPEISDNVKYFLSIIIILVIIGLFSIYYQYLGVIFSSAVMMIFVHFGLLPLSPLLGYSIGSLFIVIGIFGLIKKGGVMD